MSPQEYHHRFTQRLADLGVSPATALAEYHEWTEIDPENLRNPERDAEEVNEVLTGLPLKPKDDK